VSVRGDGLEAAPPSCPRCSAPVDHHQEYCLECGLRLPRDHHGALEHATLATGDDEPAGGWALPALVGLAVAVMGTAVALAISTADDTEAAISIATGGSLTATETGETLTAPEPGATTGATAPPATTTARPPVRTPARPPARITWPREKRGWTIVLHSFPQSDGRDTATERAEEARRRGLRNVGVLDSSRFASLHPGYFVVFTGVFDSQAEASSSLQRARAAFPSAYQREIVP
jgi:hypothetical protein